MCSHVRIWIVFLLILLLASPLSVICQENDTLSQEAFLSQYRSLLQDSDEQALEQFIREHKGLAQTAAESLMNEGNDACWRPDYEAALKAFTLSSELYRQLGDTRMQGRMLGNIGTIHRMLAEYNQAAAAYQNALEISRDVGDRFGEGTCLHNLGGVYEATSEYQQALDVYQEALKIWRELDRKDHEGTLLTNIGRIYTQLGDYQQALSLCQEGLSITRTIHNRVGEGLALETMGWIYSRLGEYRKALNLCQGALTIWRELDHKKRKGLTLNTLGWSYYNLGDYRQALDICQEALAIQREIRDRAAEGLTVNTLGLVYWNLGDYQQALVHFQNALQIWQEIGSRAQEGTTLNNIGMMYGDFGDYQRAIHYHQEALTISQEIGDHAAEGIALNNIGTIYWERGEYEESLSYFQKALLIRQKIGDQTGEADTLHNIGLNYVALREYQQALGVYQNALVLRQQIGDRAGEASTLHNIGMAYGKIADYPQALSYLQEALKLEKNIGNTLWQRRTLSGIGFFNEQQEKWSEALQYYQQAVELLETIRGRVGLQEDKAMFMETHLQDYLSIVSLLLRQKAYEEAFSYAERSKARSFLEQLHEASIRVKQGSEAPLITQENALYAKLFSIEVELQGAIADGELMQFLEERNNLEHELAVLKQRLRTLNPRYAELKYPQPVSIQQFQQDILEEGDVLIEYFQGHEELYVFVIGKRHFSTHSLAIDQQELSGKIRDLLVSLPNAVSLNHTSWQDVLPSLAHTLYHILFHPLTPVLTEIRQESGLHTLIIVPDGALFYLPFEMLVIQGGEAIEYLVDRYAIAYAPSASVLKPEILPSSKAPEAYPYDLLALAPFGEDGNSEAAQIRKRGTDNLLLSDIFRSELDSLSPLPNSTGEVKTISKLYKHAIYKTGKEATEVYLKDHATGNRYLHLSTHGYLDANQPMYSGLLFSDGMLQTYEVFNLDIDAELTVLSACQTGLGELKAGEGLVGLTRAFMYAGSPSVLVSLWPVSDPSTAAFMKRFYRNLNRGMTKAEALRETKIWMKAKSYHTDEHGNVIKHDHPFYWAPFILVGVYE